MSLKRLSPTTTRRLSSSYVISSVCDAVKELVENAIDSGATSVNVKLVNYGLDRIEVQDDGSGVPISQVEHMCLPYYTSKINEFSDLGCKLETYGFRGEALSSLCNVADVEITTRTQDDEYASVFTFDRSGKVLDSKPSHFGKGTTVAILNIFGNLPVRKKFISSSNKFKAEFKRTDALLKNFAIVNSEIYFSFCHNKVVEWRKSSARTLKESVKSILGYSIVSQLEEISTIHKKSTITLVLPNKQCKALAILCYATVDVVRIFVNRRPIKYSKLQKIALKCISDYFGGSFPQGKYPTCIVNIQVAPSDIDVNIEPNKMKVMCHEEDELLTAIEKLFMSYYTSDEHWAKTPLGGKVITNTQTKLQTNNLERNVTEKVTVQQIGSSEGADEVMNMNSEVRSELPIGNDLWTVADNAMGFWDKGYVKSATGDVIEGTKRSKIDEICENERPVEENCIKRPRLGDEKDKASTCFQFKQQASHKMKIVEDQAIHKQMQISNGVSEVKNANSVEETALPVPENSVSKATDCPMNVWSRGHVQSSSGDVVEGGAVLLQSNQSNVNSKLMKNRIQEKCKTSGDTGKIKSKNSSKFNSSFHSVSSQMGCKQMSGFTKFCRERRPTILLETPGISFTDVAKKLSDEWKKLSSEEKAKFDVVTESTKPAKTPNRFLFDSTSNVQNKSFINSSNNAQNNSLVDMFEKLNKKSEIWEVSENDWKIETHSEIVDSMEKDTSIPAKLELLHILLPEKLWICKRGQDVGIIQPSCFQEKILYKQLESSYSVPVIPMDKPLLIQEEDFQPEIWQSLTQMETERKDANVFEVACPLISKNGFRLIWENGKLYISHVASVIRNYGIEELQEILILRRNSSCLSLCRPVKVSAYLENEAVRLSNKKHPEMSKEKITELLDLWNDTYDNLCLHQRPVFKHLYTLPQMKD